MSSRTGLTVSVLIILIDERGRAHPFPMLAGDCDCVFFQLLSIVSTAILNFLANLSSSISISDCFSWMILLKNFDYSCVLAFDLSSYRINLISSYFFIKMRSYIASSVDRFQFLSDISKFRVAAMWELFLWWPANGEIRWFTMIGVWDYVCKFMFLPFFRFLSSLLAFCSLKNRVASITGFKFLKKILVWGARGLVSTRVIMRHGDTISPRS